MARSRLFIGCVILMSVYMLLDLSTRAHDYCCAKDPIASTGGVLEDNDRSRLMSLRDAKVAPNLNNRDISDEEVLRFGDEDRSQLKDVWPLIVEAALNRNAKYKEEEVIRPEDDSGSRGTWLREARYARDLQVKEKPVQVIIRLKEEKSRNARPRDAGSAPNPKAQATVGADWTLKPVSPCPEHTPAFLLILVGSPVYNYQRRRVVRSGWGKITSHNGYSIKVVFYMGKAQNATQEQELLQESKTHNDIVQSEINDGYLDLTLKNLNGFQWAIKECPTAQFILKVDDDVLVYPKNTVEYLSTLKVSNDSRLYQGFRMSDSPAHRNKAHKWYVSYETYQNATFPPYNLGFAVLFSMQAVNDIYDASFIVPNYYRLERNFPFEDAFMGICAKYLGIRPIYDHKRFFRIPTPFYKAVVADECRYLTAIAAHAVDLNLFDKHLEAGEKIRDSNKCGDQS